MRGKAQPTTSQTPGVSAEVEEARTKDTFNLTMHQLIGKYQG